MEQYRELLEKVARQEVWIAGFLTVVLVAVIAMIWGGWYFGVRKMKAKACRSEKKRVQQGKLLRQSTWAAVALSGICLLIGTVFWGSTVKVRLDIRKDLEQGAYETYSGVYQIQDYSSISRYRLYDRWATVDFEQDACAYLYVNSPVEWLQTDYGAYKGTVVFGRNSLIVVDMQVHE